MAPLSLGQDSLDGLTLGHYRLLEKIGEGGMGVVYRARDEHLKRDVAIKVLPSGLLGNERARHQFRKEALALSELSHPNIAAVHDFDTCDGIDYLVEELIPGASLDAMLAAGPLSEKECVELGLQLCAGLAAAHEHGIIHRDIKPSNLRVTPEGHLKILDFGLAKTVPTAMVHTEAAPTLSETQSVVGTFPYMSPEQVANQKLDARTDIWSLGAVLYEMATGCRPFRGQGLDVVHQILHEAPAVPSSLNPQVSPALDAAILKCLDKDPECRYHSAKELAVDLRRHVSASSAIQAPPQRSPWRTSYVVIASAVVLAVALTALATWRFAPRHARDNGAPPAQVAPSIAVLPFEDMSPDKDQEYFADGLAEELLNDLAKMPELRVTARTSSFQFKGRNEDLRVIGEKLNVASVLEGSVRKQGNRVRITAQLISASDGFHLWSETYDRNLKDVFAVQEEIARAVAGSLQVKLLGARTHSPQVTTPSAYNAYLQGRYFYQKGSKENLEKAMSYYQQAIKLDPNYAPAWAELSMARRSRAGGNLVWPELQSETNKAREEAQHALRLDPNLARAYTALASVKMLYDWNWGGANADMQQALALNPGDEETIGSAAFFAAIINHFDEALRLQRRAVEINPLSARAYHDLGFIAWWAGRPEEAIAAIQRALELDPEYPWLHTVLAYVNLEEGRPEIALAEADRDKFAIYRLQNLALAYHALGRKHESDQALTQLITTNPGADYQIAEVYAFRGQPDQAFDWLERAYVHRDGGLTCIKGDPLLKNLQHDPRYHAFLKKMGLAD